MQLFLDSAKLAEVQYWSGQGVIDGVTTNPSVLKRDGICDPLPVLTELAALITPRSLHVEVTCPAGQELVREGIMLSRIASNVVVKVPVVTPTGAPCLGEIAELDSAGVTVNATACFSFAQMMLAAKSGASYLSVLAGRVDDEGGDGQAVVRDCRKWLDDWDLNAKIVAASIRGPGDVRRNAVAGAHCLTVPPLVLAKVADHKYARHTVQEFLHDAHVT